MIHYISKFVPIWHTERYIADALEWYGRECECYDVQNPHDRPGRNGAPEVKAGDLVLSSVPQMLSMNELKAYKDKGAKLAAWYFDWIWDYQDRHLAYLPRLRMMDAVFSTDGFDSARYVSEGVTCREWLPQAAPQDSRLVDVPAGAPAHDVLFLGRLYNHDRQEIVNRLRAESINVGTYGVQSDGRRIWGRERLGLIQSAKIVIGVNFRDDVPGYWSNRIYLTLASGGFFLCRKVAGIDKLFTPGKHFAQFTGDPVKAVQRWLKRNTTRERIRRAGYEHCTTQHTYLNRVGELLARLKDKGLVR